MMSLEDRHERHLSRQRGAGARELKTAVFGFSFASFPPAVPSLPIPTSRSPRKSPGKSPEESSARSPKKSSPRKVSPLKKIDRVLPVENLEPVEKAAKEDQVQNATSCNSAQSPKKQNNIATTLYTSENKISKDEGIQRVADEVAVVVIATNNAVPDDVLADDATAPSATAATQKRKRGRPAAKDKEPVAKRQRTARGKITKAKEVSEDDYPNEVEKDAVEPEETGLNRDVVSKGISSNVVRIETVIENSAKTIAPKRSRIKKEKASTTKGMTDTNDRNEVDVDEGISSGKRIFDVDETAGRRSRRKGAQPRYAESDEEIDDNKKNAKTDVATTKKTQTTLVKSSHVQGPIDEKTERSNTPGETQAEEETRGASEVIPKRRGRPRKAANVAPEEVEKTAPARKARARQVPAKSVPQDPVVQPEVAIPAEYKEERPAAMPAATEDQQEDEPENSAKPTNILPKRRGRPPKSKAQSGAVPEVLAQPDEELMDIVPVHGKPESRGRVKKIKAQPETVRDEEPSAAEEAAQFADITAPTMAGTRLRRGRATKAIQAQSLEPITAKENKADLDTHAPIATEGDASRKVIEEVKAQKRRGRKPKREVEHETSTNPLMPAEAVTQLEEFPEEPQPIQTKSKRLRTGKKTAATTTTEIGSANEAVIDEKEHVPENDNKTVLRRRGTKQAETSVLPKVDMPALGTQSATIVENIGPETTEATSRQPLALTAYSTNLMVSPRRARSTKSAKLPMFKMTSRRRAEGEWQKEDWFEPSVPSTLLR